MTRSLIPTPLATLGALCFALACSSGDGEQSETSDRLIPAPAPPDGEAQAHLLGGPTLEPGQTLGAVVGLDNLAAAIGESSDTIEDVIEPYLIQQGFLHRTPRGRMATQATYRHLGLAPPTREGDLFGA